MDGGGGLARNYIPHSLSQGNCSATWFRPCGSQAWSDTSSLETSAPCGIHPPRAVSHCFYDVALNSVSSSIATRSTCHLLSSLLLPSVPRKEFWELESAGLWSALVSSALWDHLECAVYPEEESRVPATLAHITANVKSAPLALLWFGPTFQGTS